MSSYENNQAWRNNAWQPNVNDWSKQFQWQKPSQWKSWNAWNKWHQWSQWNQWNEWKKWSAKWSKKSAEDKGHQANHDAKKFHSVKASKK